MSENPKLFKPDGFVHAESGQAFGLHYSTDITLRDLFAGFALAGLNAAKDYSSGPCNASAAERCYALADAMLAERAKP